MKVLMIPELKKVKGQPDGISRVIEAYHEQAPKFGIEYVEKGQRSDLICAHAGLTGAQCDCAMLHGTYWTADYPSTRWQLRANANIVSALRHAKEITVPSAWVAETLQRDMRISPTVIPHGIKVQEWDHADAPEDYVLWNKNRTRDVCSPADLTELAKRFPTQRFLTTFATGDAPPNIMNMNKTLPHDEMKPIVQRAMVYLSTTKETFGIGILEAMASGVPVLGWRQGGNVDLVRHGVTGYLADVGNYDDLAEGLAYCLLHRDTLGANGREVAKEFTWEKAFGIVAEVYQKALEPDKPTVAIVIPSYKYGDVVGRAIESATKQTYPHITDIVVVDDGTPDDGLTGRVVEGWSKIDSRVRYVRQENRGVAVARNRGISEVDTKYISCLDADDEMEPTLIEKLVAPLEMNRSLGISYSKLLLRFKDGNTGIGKWPNEFDFDRQAKGHNQVPTCCVFRREGWARTGGYKQRYAPTGAGAEDAEFWLRLGALGYGGTLATEQPLFVYSIGTGHTAQDGYKEADWLSWHPWVYDGEHPFASVATPNNISHLVRQYDEPDVSVVIPVGPGHEWRVTQALDSLESQTYRRWEAVVVWDSDVPIPQRIIDAYPYVRWQATWDNHGAGAARNIGVENARARLILFLDADDWLYPEAINYMLGAWNDSRAAVYTDYTGMAFIADADVSRIKDKIAFSDGEWRVLSKNALPYNPERIQRGVEDPPYIWNLVTTLFPKSWHYEIGGFDESMETWEDYDYWVRMAWAGKPFHHLEEELVIYPYYTGSRRDQAHKLDDTGRKLGATMLEYIRSKLKGVTPVGCSGCGKGRRRPTQSVGVRRDMRSQSIKQDMLARDADFVKCRFAGTPPGNTGMVQVIGNYLFDFPLKDVNMRQIGQQYKIDYGRQKKGRIFLVHKRDAELAPHTFDAIEEIGVAAGAVARPTDRVEPPPPPPAIAPAPRRVEDVQINHSDPPPHIQTEVESIEPEPEPPQVDKTSQIADNANMNLQLIPGVSANVADELKRDGYGSLNDILALGAEGLQNYKGVGTYRAQTIIAAIQAMLSTA